MVARYLIALVGAAAVTVGLFLFMDDVANRLALRDGTMYFKITDFIPAPDPGRQLPDAPPLPELRPAIPDLPYDGPDHSPLDVADPAQPEDQPLQPEPLTVPLG